MPTVESLKAEHPMIAEVLADIEACPNESAAFPEAVAISALTAAKLEDEATIREQQRMIQEADRILAEAGERVGCYFGSDTADEMANKIRELEGCLIAEQEHTAHVESQLSAEQAAHAATKEKLKEADKALISCYYHDDCQSPAYCGVCANAICDGHEPDCLVPAALARIQTARATEPEETK